MQSKAISKPASDDSALRHNSCLYETPISLDSMHPTGTITRWKFLQHSTSLTRREKRLPKAIKPRSASRTTCVKMVLRHAMHAPITGIKVGESKIYSIDEYFMMFFSSLSMLPSFAHRRHLRGLFWHLQIQHRLSVDRHHWDRFWTVYLQSLDKSRA